MRDMTEGNIRKHIISFATPLFIGNLLQLANTIIDRMWAGKFISADALAAISICGSIFFIMLSISIGLASSASIMISQYFGAKEKDKLRYVVGNSFILILITSFISTMAIQLFHTEILQLIKTPAEIMDYAENYLTTLSLGFFFVLAFNMLNSFFRAIGNSMLPLKCLIISVCLNALLDPFLMLGWGPFPRLELTGAALATIFAQFVAFISGFIYMQSQKTTIAISWHHLKPVGEIINKMFKLAIPASIRFSLLSVGLTVIQAMVNKFGTVAAAAYGATNNIDQIILHPAMSISSAVSTIVGQNLGARKIDRAKETMKQGIYISLTVISGFIIFFFFFPKIILLVFLKESSTEVLAHGCAYLRIIAVPYFFIMTVLVILGLIEGAGDTFATMILSIINLWIVRVPLVALFSHFFGITGIWIGLGIAYVLDFTFTFSYYKLGRWKKKVIL